jgi:hypothetical protein
VIDWLNVHDFTRNFDIVALLPVAVLYGLPGSSFTSKLKKARITEGGGGDFENNYPVIFM